MKPEDIKTVLDALLIYSDAQLSAEGRTAIRIMREAQKIAEPVSERDMFEISVAARSPGCDLNKNKDGVYENRYVHHDWEGWQARAAQKRETKPLVSQKGPDSIDNGGPAYGIIDPDYARVYTQARIVAWQYGYACVMHGSFTRDLDLLLVPWTDQARDNGDQLLKLIAQGAGLRFGDGLEEVYKSKVDWTDKPHGRKSCSLYFPEFGDRRWVDISVVPRVAQVADGGVL